MVSKLSLDFSPVLKPDTRALIKSFIIPKIEKKPLAVIFKFLAFSLLSLRLFVKSLRFLVIANKSLAVFLGNTSLRASLTGFIILINASKEFFNESISIVLPPALDHWSSTLFLASADLLIISLNVSEIDVQNFLASSKSPIMYSHD